jgi:probable F420-dependent oxidoreductase
MKIDAFGAGLELHRAGERARDFASIGYDGLWLAEAGRTAYLTCAATALAAPEMDVGTAVATAFPRSPMVTAQIAWELAEATQGRFILGLGTQIKAHIERRFSTTYDHPGARLREYVLALRAIFRAFSGQERLNFKGDFYSFNLLGMWTPGPMPYPEIPIYLAAVRPWMLRAAGEVADGIHVHPFHSRRYLDEVIVPSVAQGARRVAAAGALPDCLLRIDAGVRGRLRAARLARCLATPDGVATRRRHRRDGQHHHRGDARRLRHHRDVG